MNKTSESKKAVSREALLVAIDALKKEVGKESISPERVTALSEAIKALNQISPLLQF